MLLSLLACNSQRLESVSPGDKIPVVSKTSKIVNKSIKPKEVFRPEKTTTQSSKELDILSPTIERKSPSLIPYLTKRVIPQEKANVFQQPPLARLAPSSAVRVALMVPLSGPNEKLGRSMLNAAQMALFDFSDANFELLIFDTLGTPEGALEAASLAIGDGVSIILGPLLGTSIDAVAPIARAANVSVIGFSSNRMVARTGVYTMGFFPETEVERVVSFAMQRGLKRFAALAPTGAYGETVIDSLRETVAEYSGEVDQVLFYDPQTEDFSEIVRELADYDTRRQALIDQRAELEQRNDDIAKSALKRLEKLQTLGDVPFDALLLADGGKRLLAIAALLPFYDIDPKKVRMLGTGQWDMPGLGSEPALSGGWHAGPPPEARSDFVRQYKEMYGVVPHRLATLAYDATALSSIMARSEGGPNFSNEILTTRSGFWGRDGIFRFQDDGTVDRGLAVLQVEARRTKVISPPPEVFSE